MTDHIPSSWRRIGVIFADSIFLDDRKFSRWKIPFDHVEQFQADRLSQNQIGYTQRCDSIDFTTKAGRAGQTSGSGRRGRFGHQPYTNHSELNFFWHGRPDKMLIPSVSFYLKPKFGRLFCLFCLNFRKVRRSGRSCYSKFKIWALPKSVYLAGLWQFDFITIHMAFQWWDGMAVCWRKCQPTRYSSRQRSKRKEKSDLRN